MGRTALLALLPALLIATGWQRLEDPVLASHFSLAAALAIAAFFLTRVLQRSVPGS